MSNRAVLWAGQRNPAEWTRGDDSPRCIELLGADYLLPLFWLCLFEPDNLESYRDRDGESFLPWRNKVPYLIGGREECRRNFERRRSFLENVLAKVGDYLPKWQTLLSSVDAKYLSVDFSEIYWMDPNSVKHVRGALESMAGSEASDSLLRITSLVGLYDRNTRDFETTSGRFTKPDFVVGYKIDAPVEWFTT